MKVSEEYSKSTLTYLNKLDIWTFQIGGGVHMQKKKWKMIENDLTQK